MVRCWRCQTQLPPRRTACWKCGADQRDAGPIDETDRITSVDEDMAPTAKQTPGGFAVRSDPDGEFCDDPDCGDCDDDWDDTVADDGMAGGPASMNPPPMIPMTHPSQFTTSGLGRQHAAMMHPAARTELIDVGLLPRLFAAFLSLVVWWVVVLAGFFLATVLYDSPPIILVLGLMLVPVLGETALNAEFGFTPGKFLLGMRVCSGGSVPGWSRSIVRTFVVIAPFVPMLLGGVIGDISFLVGSAWLVVLMISIAIDPDMRGLHDRVAGTSVVFKAPVCR